MANFCPLLKTNFLPPLPPPPPLMLARQMKLGSFWKEKSFTSLYWISWRSQDLVYLSWERACPEFSELGFNKRLWFNRNIRSKTKTKSYIYYKERFDLGIIYINDLLNPPLPGSKLNFLKKIGFRFWDLFTWQGKKNNFLMKLIPVSWLQSSNFKNIDVLDSVGASLLQAQRVTRFALFWQKHVFHRVVLTFGTFLLIMMFLMTAMIEDTDWEEIHVRS